MSLDQSSYSAQGQPIPIAGPVAVDQGLNSPLFPEAKQVAWLNPDAVAVFDLDIGKDPDDSVVAAFVALHKEEFNPALFITNDEASSLGRVRFLSQLFEELEVDIRVAAGLPSVLRRETTLVERAGLLRERAPDFESEGVAVLTEVLASNPQVNYFGLGALTNLATVLAHRPELAERVTLVQMGMAFAGAFPRSEAQYNVKLDTQSFRDVLERAVDPTFLMTHASWGSFDKENDRSRQQLGLYTDDPVFSALSASDRDGLRLVAQHLQAWHALKGRHCSIMHDPLTVLSQYDREMVDYLSGEIVYGADGHVDATKTALASMRDLERARLSKIERYLESPDLPVSEGFTRTVRFSLNTDYDRARMRLTEVLFGKQFPDLATAWAEHNRDRDREV